MMLILKYVVIGLFFIAALVLCCFLIRHFDSRDININKMSPIEIVELYLKIRAEKTHDKLKEIVCFPNDEMKLNNLMAGDAEKTLYSSGAKRKATYEKIVNFDTAEVGIVLVIAGKTLPLQQMILKKDGGIWKLAGAKFDNYSKDQLYEILKSPPVDSDIFYYLGKQYSTDRFARAANYYEKYLELSDNKFWNSPDMQVILKQGKEIDTFIAQYKPQVDANPLFAGNDTLCAKLALAYMDKGDWANAERYLNIMKNILEKSPNKYMRDKYNQIKKEFDFVKEKHGQEL